HWDWKRYALTVPLEAFVMCIFASCTPFDEQPTQHGFDYETLIPRTNSYQYPQIYHPTWCTCLLLPNVSLP
ncbi:DUF1196 domain-containing protein, partial [Vibrio cholerae]|nr:DUF1196 domain-containing protein [Vibrio cholerae]